MKLQSYIFKGLFTMLLLSLFFYGNLTVSADSGQTYKVGTSSLNVRTAPSKNAEVIGRLVNGNQVVVFHEAYGWVQTYYNGQEAWIAKHYLYKTDKKQMEAVSTPSILTVIVNNVRIRSGPGTHHNVVGSTNSGNTYKLIETKNDWHKIILHDGSTGWIAAWLTDNTTNIAPVPISKKTTKPKQRAKTSLEMSHKSLKGYNIVLDPGHGGRDPGAIGFNGAFEKDIVMSTATRVANKLRDAGATVIMTRSHDRNLSLEDRVYISNAYATHAFISLHYDAHIMNSINGFSTHFYSSLGEDRQLAQYIQSGIAQQVHLKNRGIVESNLFVLRENKDLAVLVELGFITNPFDLSIIQTADYQDAVAEGIKNGLVNYFY